MGYYGLFKYGSGVLYGIATAISAVDPIEGPAPGGNKFVITGEGFDPRQWDDEFTGAILNPAKWTDISGGSGAITTGANHLGLTTGVVVGSVAGVQSVVQWGNTQGEIRAILATPVAQPPANVNVLEFQLYVDASNYVTVYLELTTTGVFTLHCESWMGGVMVDEFKNLTPWTVGLSMFKLLRWGTDIYLIANGSVIWRIRNFVTTAAYFQIYSANLTSAYDVNTVKVEWFYFRPFAVFQDQPVHDTVVVGDRRIRGIVTASRDVQWQAAAYEGLVDVSVVANGDDTSTDAYEYYYINGLKSINSVQSDVEMDVINDDQLVTPDGEDKGLGGGF